MLNLVRKQNSWNNNITHTHTHTHTHTLSLSLGVSLSLSLCLSRSLENKRFRVLSLSLSLPPPLSLSLSHTHTHTHTHTKSLSLIPPPPRPPPPPLPPRQKTGYINVNQGTHLGGRSCPRTEWCSRCSWSAGAAWCSCPQGVGSSSPGQRCGSCQDVVQSGRTFCWENTLLAAMRQWRTSSECSTETTHCLLQWDSGELHQNVLLREHAACCNETVENFIRTFY